MLTANATLTSPDGESTTIKATVPPGANPVYIALAAVEKTRREEQGNQRPKVMPIMDRKQTAHFLLLSLTPDERRGVMAQFCGHCGSDDPRCKCSRDE